MSQTPTSSARSACLSMASKWLAEIRPHPTSANRIRRSRDEGLGDEHGSRGAEVDERECRQQGAVPQGRRASGAARPAASGEIQADRYHVNSFTRSAPARRLAGRGASRLRWGRHAPSEGVLMATATPRSPPSSLSRRGGQQAVRSARDRDPGRQAPPAAPRGPGQEVVSPHRRGLRRLHRGDHDPARLQGALWQRLAARGHQEHVPRHRDLSVAPDGGAGARDAEGHRGRPQHPLVRHARARRCSTRRRPSWTWRRASAARPRPSPSPPSSSGSAPAACTWRTRTRPTAPAATS